MCRRSKLVTSADENPARKLPQPLEGACRDEAGARRGWGRTWWAEVKLQDKEALAEGLLQDDLLVLLVTNSFVALEAKRPYRLRTTLPKRQPRLRDAVKIMAHR